MDEIAEAAGVTKPVLYQHFPSKRALYVELLEETGRQLLSTLADATARAGSLRGGVLIDPVAVGSGRLPSAVARCSSVACRRNS